MSKVLIVKREEMARLIVGMDDNMNLGGATTGCIILCTSYTSYLRWARGQVMMLVLPSTAGKRIAKDVP